MLLSWFRRSRSRALRTQPAASYYFRPVGEGLEPRVVLSPPGTGWQMLWADEFNGTSLDTGKWAVASGTHRDATDTASAVSVGGGYLTITTYTSGGHHYTGYIGTYNSFKATYGYWEARIDFQDSPGMWSAFWDQSPTIGNPLGNPAVAGTEIDTVEHRYSDASGTNISNQTQTNLHWDGYGANEKNAGSGNIHNPGGVPLQGNFHLYALQWSPTSYQFYIDGTQVWSSTQAVSHRSEFIYLTSEVQNNSWAGNIPTGGYGSLTTSTTKMIVDYVRVWQKPTSGIPDQVISEGASSPTLPVTVTQKDGATTTATATSSNTTLFPGGSLHLGGSGANRTLQLTPAAGQTGTATVTVTASNGVVNGGSTFQVTVSAGSFQNGGFEDNPVGVGWSLSGSAAVVDYNQRSGSRAMRMNGSPGTAQQVVSGLSPNTTYTLGGWERVSYPSAEARIGVKNYGGPELWSATNSTSYVNGNLIFTTGPTSTQATVYVSKPANGNAADFDDVYLFRAPTLLVSDQQTAANTSTGPLPLLLGNVSSDPSKSSIAATSSDQTLVPDGNLVVNGSGANTTLTITPAPGLTGTAVITVTVHDAFGGSAARSFILTVQPPAPSPWTDQDIGNVGWPGGSGFDGATYLVQGSGADIWNTADAFHFLYQPLTGDGEITARVAGEAATGSYAKAGVMIRETLDPGSKHALIDLTPSHGAEFIRRTATGAAAVSQFDPAAVAPYWVRLVRSGDTFTAYDSPDGVSWNWINSVPIPMAQTVYAGLAVCAFNNGAVNASTFDNVSVVAQADLSAAFNQTGAVSDGAAFAGGLDGNGDAYSAALLGSALSANGYDFNLGAADAANAVQAAGQTISLPAGQFAVLSLLGTGVNGPQPGQTFIVSYADGSSDTFTQDLSDWLAPQGYGGEAVAAALGYYNYQDGSSPAVANYLYQYSFILNGRKAVSSITLPANGNVLVLALDLGTAGTANPAPGSPRCWTGGGGENATPWAAAGELPHDSVRAGVPVVPGNGAAFPRRGAPDGLAANANGGGRTEYRQATMDWAGRARTAWPPRADTEALDAVLAELYNGLALDEREYGP